MACFGPLFHDDGDDHDDIDNEDHDDSQEVAGCKRGKRSCQQDDFLFREVFPQTHRCIEHVRHRFLKPGSDISLARAVLKSLFD